MTIAAAGITMCSLLATGSAHAAMRVTSASSLSPLATTASTSTPYPVGVFDLDEPSGLAPPTTSALPGYTRTFVDDFTSPLGRQWFYFNGIPSGDPDGRFNPAHVAVMKGLLKVGTWRDPRFGNNWVSGGAGLSGVPLEYGAIFVRSRETAPGPDTVELLWPENNQWPPEIDFDEAGESQSNMMWFVHYDSPSDQVYGRTSVNIEHWNTWGVIWTPTSITFTVNGYSWGEVTNSSEIPHLPMTLDLQAQSWCGISGEPCPSQDSTLDIDWVAIYQPKST